MSETDDPTEEPDATLRAPSPETRSLRLEREAWSESLDLAWLREGAAERPSPAPAPREDLAPGTRIGPYELIGILGRGGMGSVYRAWEPEAMRFVALKLLDPERVAEPRSLRRFRQEAVLAAQLEDPRIVRVLAYGESSGRAWLAMELAVGPTLDAVVEQEGPLEPARAARVVAQVARALAAAHAGGVLHRDLKPSNVILSEGDRPLVLDFGLAKDLRRDRSLTASNEFIGTPVFVAPEMIAGGAQLDERADVYGLGGILFFLLTGRPLHEGVTGLRILDAVLRDTPPRLREVDPGLPWALDRVCAQALARDREDRYGSALAMAEDLDRFLGEGAVLARPPGPVRRWARAAWRRPRLAALAVVTLAGLALSPFLAIHASEGIARRQRARQALDVLDQARLQAVAGRHAEAEQQFLHAMLLAKGAFLEDPRDRVLRAALRDVKQSRAEHAEDLGHWELAQELRTNLDRLEGDEGEPLPAASAPATLRVRGLVPGASLHLRPWPRDQGARPELRSVDADASVSLPAGSYLAAHSTPGGPARTTYLLVVGAGTVHELRLGAELLTPQGAWRLPPATELLALDELRETQAR